MNILKRLLNLQAGRSSFQDSRVLNLLGAIGGKKEPLIPYDKDMQGCLVLSNIQVEGSFNQITFKQTAVDEYLALSSITVEGSFAHI